MKRRKRRKRRRMCYVWCQGSLWVLVRTLEMQLAMQV